MTIMKLGPKAYEDLDEDCTDEEFEKAEEAQQRSDEINEHLRESHYDEDVWRDPQKDYPPDLDD